MSTPAQKKTIKEFKAVTSVTDKIATDVLTANGYNLERAVDDYFSNKHKYGGASSSSSSSSASASKVDAKKLAAIFDEYASEDDSDSIDGANLAKFFEALGLNTAGPGPLALAWQYRCENFATVERKEFSAYYSRAGIDTLPAMKADAKRVEESLKDKKQFKEFYRWLFEFVKEEEERKTIDNNMAFSLWSCVLPVHFSATEEWVKFCKSQKSLKMVSFDLWQQLWEFAKDFQPDLANFDADGAWPVVIDEFVEHLRKIKK